MRARPVSGRPWSAPWAMLEGTYIGNGRSGITPGLDVGSDGLTSRAKHEQVDACTGRGMPPPGGSRELSSHTRMEPHLLRPPTRWFLSKEAPISSARQRV